MTRWGNDLEQKNKKIQEQIQKLKDKIRVFENDAGYDKSYNGYKEYRRNKNPKVKKEYSRYLMFKSNKKKLKKLVSKNEKLVTLGEPELKGK